VVCRQVVKHKDSVPVMEVQFQKVPTVAGQYIFINCPKVALFEVHHVVSRYGIGPLLILPSVFFVCLL
jgi:hypothetical protein